MKKLIPILFLFLFSTAAYADGYYPLPDPIQGTQSLASALVPLGSQTGIATGLTLAPTTDGSLYSLTFSLPGSLTDLESIWQTPYWIFTPDGTNWYHASGWDSVTFTFPSFSGTENGKLIVTTTPICNSSCISTVPQAWYDFQISDPPYPIPFGKSTLHKFAFESLRGSRVAAARTLWTTASPVSTPEPASLLLFGVGLLTLGARGVLRK